MAGCKEDDFINVLVLGSSNIKISQFLKLFAAYLKYDTSKEVMFYEPNLKTEEQNVAETRSYITEIQGHNFHFIDTPGLQKSYRSYKEICDILLHFKATTRLHAIILLIEPDRKGSENYFEQYTAHFLHGLKQFANNLLYVVLSDDSCMFDRTYRNFQKAMDTIRINAFVPQKSNVFHLNEDTFFTVEDNWEESVNFCRDVFDYITGNDLKSFYVQCMIPTEETFLKLAYNLIELLVEVYYFAQFFIMNNRFYYIYDYQKNTTVCYGKNCHTWKYFDNGKQLKVPKVCHELCTCGILSLKCSVFQTPNKNCSSCGCNLISHRRNIFHKKYSETFLNPRREKNIAITTLIKLLSFIKSHGFQSISIDNCITKEFEGYTHSEVILEILRHDFETQLKSHSETKITREKLLVCVHRLYEIKDGAKIIPQIINESFPDGLRLEVTSKAQISESREVKLLRTENQNVKAENQNIKVENRKIKVQNQNMKKELDELKQRLDQILNCYDENNLSANNFKLENTDKFNIKQSNEDVD